MIVRYFPDTHMGLGHKGLSEIARAHRINTYALTAGEYVIFTNKKLTAVKVFAPGNVIAYKKVPGGLDLAVIQQIPFSFNGAELDLNAAIRKALLKRLGKGVK